MYPWLRVGPYVVQWYHVFIGIGLLAAFISVAILARKEKLSVLKYFIATLCVFTFGYLGAHLLSLILLWNSIPHTLEGIWTAFWRGMYWYGGPMLGIPATIFFVRILRLPVRTSLDFGGVALAIGQAFGRIGCFTAGCCYGKPTDSIFGVRFPAVLRRELVNIPIHPVQLYETVLLFGLFGFLFWYFRRRSFPGEVALLYLIFAPLIRVFTELFRADRRGYIFDQLLSTTEAMSLIIMTVAVVIHIVISNRRRIGVSPKLI